MSSRSQLESIFLTDNLSYLEEYLKKIEVTQDEEITALIADDLSSFVPLKARSNGLVQHASSSKDLKESIVKSLRALMLIRAYRVLGHFGASLDPLYIQKPNKHPELDAKHYGFQDDDFNHSLHLDNVLGLEEATLQDLLTRLESIYCSTIGFEFMHIQNSQQKSWLQERIESRAVNFSKDEKFKMLKHLLKAELFEGFLHKKYPGVKRFGCEGAESSLVVLETILDYLGATYDLEELILGMAHRGRLNVLSNFMEQPLRYLFAQFNGHEAFEFPSTSSWDVKYHQGYSNNREVKGKNVHLSLTANPSHLEAVNPVVMGKVRAKQDIRDESKRNHVVGVLIHGDASFAGQGLVAETLELSALKGYSTKGTLHLIINNQIGFTTSPPMSRSSPYCSDLAKVIQAPIFHVNGDDIESVAWVTKLAVDFQQTFQQDVVIDLVCYRRHGHNEGDEPMFTQPKMYSTIAKKESTASLYRQKLLSEHTITQKEVESLIKDINDHLIKEHEISLGFDKKESVAKRAKADWLKGMWEGIQPSSQDDNTIITGINIKKYDEALLKSFKIPSHIEANSKVKRLYEMRERMLRGEVPFDWGMGEMLAYASLLIDGHHVRLSGQDSGRGTFSHRHAVIVDQKNEERYIPLQNLASNQGKFDVIDSPLAEASVLGFEYGYSLSSPHSLTLWEGQFGDFANGAQVIIDQFISSSQAKWLRLSGLVLLLPHGYEGQGPEHSSARLERYLQLSAENNWYVMNCTTPSNFFHALRRQVLSESRKPLVMMTPKSLLRHKLAVSNLEDFLEDQTLRKVEPEKNIDLSKAKRIILCTGKVFYDLLEMKEKLNLSNVAIVRIEQLYPFPYQELEQILRKAPTKADVIWCQEEPLNMGAWTFIDSRIESVLQICGFEKDRPFYAGRNEASSPATGIAKRHESEQMSLLEEALLHKPTRAYWK